jgi:hypothetical protein
MLKLNEDYIKLGMIFYFYHYASIIYVSKRLSPKLEIKIVVITEDMDSETSDFEHETSSHFDDGNIASDSINMDVEQEKDILFDDGNISSDVQEEDEESLASSDDEFENEEEFRHDTQWTTDAFDYHKVKVPFEDVGEDMKQTLREGVTRLKEKVHTIGSLHSFASDSKCEELINFSLFANFEFWQHLTQFLNKNWSSNMEVLHAFIMTKFIRCLLWCAYYQKSPGHMITNRSLFPGFDSELRALEGIGKFNEVKALFKSPKKQL